MANRFYLSVKGNKQGDLKRDKGKNQTKIPILGFSYAINTPYDIATGQPTGKRQHKPITVYKVWGEISPQLFEAQVSNEVLTSVIIDEMRINPQGKKEVYMEIRLTNASIVEIQIEPGRSDDPPAWMDHEIERISLVFEKIDIENKVSKAAAEDDWEQRA
jgi:type VI secretion system secreted protein Hcp